MSEINQGKVVQIMGAVVDVKFNDNLPAILDALEIEQDGKKLVPMDVKVGDKVLFGKWSGTEVKIDGKEYSIMKESDIMGISGK